MTGGQLFLVAWVAWTVLVAALVKFSWVDWWRQLGRGYNE
jgi:hypothetical protein